MTLLFRGFLKVAESLFPEPGAPSAPFLAWKKATLAKCMYRSTSGLVVCPWVQPGGTRQPESPTFPLQVSSAAETEAITSQKLVKSHAYSVTGVEEVKGGRGKGKVLGREMTRQPAGS